MSGRGRADRRGRAGGRGGLDRRGRGDDRGGLGGIGWMDHVGGLGDRGGTSADGQGDDRGGLGGIGWMDHVGGLGDRGGTSADGLRRRLRRSRRSRGRLRGRPGAGRHCVLASGCRGDVPGHRLDHRRRRTNRQVGNLDPRRGDPGRFRRPDIGGRRIVRGDALGLEQPNRERGPAIGRGFRLIDCLDDRPRLREGLRCRLGFRDRCDCLDGRLQLLDGPRRRPGCSGLLDPRGSAVVPTAASAVTSGPSTAGSIQRRPRWPPRPAPRPRPPV